MSFLFKKKKEEIGNPTQFQRELGGQYNSESKVVSDLPPEWGFGESANLDKMKESVSKGELYFLCCLLLKNLSLTFFTVILPFFALHNSSN